MLEAEKLKSDRIEATAETFEREEYALADRAVEVRAFLAGGFTAALLCMLFLSSNPERAATLLALTIPATVWLFNRWRDSAARRIAAHCWLIESNQFTAEQIVAIRRRVFEIRATRRPLRHEHPSFGFSQRVAKPQDSDQPERLEGP